MPDAVAQDFAVIPRGQVVNSSAAVCVELCYACLLPLLSPKSTFLRRPVGAWFEV